jgi:hypothetical protein
MESIEPDDKIKNPVDGGCVINDIENYIRFDGTEYGIVIKPFYAYKKATGNALFDDIILKLIIPVGCEVHLGTEYQRCKKTIGKKLTFMFKCRSSIAYVEKIYDDKQHYARSFYNRDFVYHKNQYIKPVEDFYGKQVSDKHRAECDCADEICKSGIHWFFTYELAASYNHC